MPQATRRRVGSAGIAALLRREIVHGNLHHHDRLPPERELAEQHGVSRGTVREALKRLSIENLVEIRRGSGTFIIGRDSPHADTPSQTARPLELIDARFAFEPHICRLAVLTGRHSDFDALEELLEQMEQCSEDPVAFSEFDTQFHTRLVETTGNSLLIWIASQMNAVRSLDEWTRMRQLTLKKAIINQYNAQHRQIVNAIRSREPERAATLMKEHLETARLSLTRAAET